MLALAWRNLVHDKVRLAVTVTGIVFAVVLIVVELGLFLGFTTTTSSLIDRSGADLWITAKNVPYIELGVPFTERKLATVLATPGVAAAGKDIAQFTQWKRPDGRQESVQVVGVELPSGLGLPWNVVAGAVDDRSSPSAYIARLFSIGTPRPRNSCGWYARPTPNFSRPRLSTSTSAKSDAVRSGWLNGMTTTAVPIAIRRVRIAIAAASTCVEVTTP